MKKIVTAVVCLSCVTWGAVVPQAATSASSARYTAQNLEFWKHQGTATVDWYGTKLTGTPRR